MNTDPTARVVLCFGDSNTHGMPSDDEDYRRLAADVRWTGRLQSLLGSGFYIIEEGLNGRTTDLDYVDRPGCNGRPYLLPCLLSHSPMDAVVVMLGTNDLKVQFDRPAATIADALHGYVDDIEVAAACAGATPVTILVSPILLQPAEPAFAEGSEFDAHSLVKSTQLADEIRRVATARDVVFVDAAAVAHAGSDGVHLSADSHQRLAELLATTISRTLGSREE